MTGGRVQTRLASHGSWADAAQHLAGLVPAVAVVVVLGRADLRYAWVIPVGTVVIGVLAERLSPSPALTARHRREALAFSVVVAAGLLLVAGLLVVGASTPLLALLVPVGILAVPIIVLAWLTLAVLAASRAWHGLLLHYPLVPQILRPEEDH